MSSRELTFDEKFFMDDLSAFGQALFSHSCTIEAQVGTPKAVSLMLFNRLWSNYRGYVVLWKAGHTLYEAAAEEIREWQDCPCKLCDIYPIDPFKYIACLAKVNCWWGLRRSIPDEQQNPNTSRFIPTYT